jgi:hypothetical protein
MLNGGNRNGSKMEEGIFNGAENFYFARFVGR